MRIEIGRSREERREFWGTTPSSLLSCAGFISGVTGSFLYIMHPAFIVLAVVGLGLLVLGITLDFHKGLDVKWRKVNLCFHIAFLVLVVCCTVAAVIVKVIEQEKIETFQQTDAPDKK